MVKAIVIMGVSSAGKTTIALALNTRLHWQFAEADKFHSFANIELMRAGIALEDSQRWPWLSAIRYWINNHANQQQSMVLTCSALKKSYRQFLATANAEVIFVYLQVPIWILQQRVMERHHPYMPASLLRSQLTVLEPLTNDEQGITIKVKQRSIENIVSEILARLALTANSLLIND